MQDNITFRGNNANIDNISKKKQHNLAKIIF